MNFSSVSSITDAGFESSALAGTQATKRQDSAFSDLLQSAKEGASVNELRTSAEQLVSATFIIPVLSSVREASMSAEPFAPTQGEKQFGAMLDQQVADEIVRSANLPLVDRLAETFGANTKAVTSSSLEVSG